MRRFTPPCTVPNLTRFSDDEIFASPHHLVSTIKGMADIWLPLRDAINERYHWGPERMRGEWGLVYLAFVIGRIPDMQPWYRRVKDDLPFWQVCGFERVPKYKTLWLRFTKLEERADAFQAAAARLIQKARACDDRIGQWLHIDASEAETQGSPKHDCRPGDPCPTRGARKQPRLTRLDTDTVAEVRRKGAEQPLDAVYVQVTAEGVTTAVIEDEVRDDERRGVRFKSGGHFWFRRDPTAGLRAFTKNGQLQKAWTGFEHVEMVCHFTGAPVASVLIPADQMEHLAYPRVYEQAKANLGGLDPVAVAADRGYAFPNVFEYNALRKVGSVIPYRRTNGHSPKTAVATDLFDEHGVPFCRFCGGGTDFVRSYVENARTDHPRARVDFRCAARCRNTVQTVYCDRDYRRLLMLWRTNPVYQALRQSHWSFEGKHAALRAHYLLAPKTFDIRPKRMGIRWQQLRANAALLIEWVRVTLKMSWATGGGGPAAEVKVTDFENVRAGITARRARLGRTGGQMARGRPPDQVA